MNHEPQDAVTVLVDVRSQSISVNTFVLSGCYGLWVLRERWFCRSSIKGIVEVALEPLKGTSVHDGLQFGLALNRNGLPRCVSGEVRYTKSGTDLI